MDTRMMKDVDILASSDEDISTLHQLLAKEDGLRIQGFLEVAHNVNAPAES